MPSNIPSSKKKKAESDTSKIAAKTKAPAKKTTVAKKLAPSVVKKNAPTSPKKKDAVVIGGLKVGSRAPAFSLPNEKGEIVKLSELKGKKIVLFFYPKDDTSGCTKEACSFRDGLQAIRKKGAVVLGVSADSVASHQKFSQKYDFNFPLLSDESKAMIQAYGVWKEKSMYGRHYMGIERTTLLIAKDGTIGQVFSKVKVDGHYEEVLAALG
ncbi:MAG: thioredoxin-dependent thiol peroxidase [Nitrospirales bacterium]|nr:MAG: thioredoxin-dependent thiol peroxidase [Nitrospirales bacterium]